MKHRNVGLSVLSAFIALSTLSGCGTTTPRSAAASASGNAGTQVGAQAINNLAPTPPMGWNSWNRYACNIDENLIKRQADAMVSNGMKAAGYQYINIDDCWQVSRDSAGNIVADPQRFPNGIKGVADYVHSRGLKFGIYSDRGTKTCTGQPGSQDHEVQDARSYASWGVDYLKYDNCYADQDAGVQRRQYEAMRDALASAGRPIVYSICAGWTGYRDWMTKTGNLWRTTDDIFDSWDRMISLADINNRSAYVAAPNTWNDPDMLMVGNYGAGAIQGGGMNDQEYRTHFSLWALMAAPLIAGNDLANMNAFTHDTLTNTEVIAVDQDPLGVQGTRVSRSGDVELWAKPLQGGDRAVVLVNTGSAAATGTVNFADVGLSGSVQVRDLWARADRGSIAGAFSVAGIPSHGSVMLRLKGTQAPVNIRINDTDPRAIQNLKVSVQLYAGGQRHVDSETVANLDQTYRMNLNAWGMTYNAAADQWEGNMLATTGSAAGSKAIDIAKVDTQNRHYMNTRVSVEFDIGGAHHYDYEDLGELWKSATLTLNGNGGTFDGTRFVGDFLHR